MSAVEYGELSKKEGPTVKPKQEVACEIAGVLSSVAGVLGAEAVALDAADAACNARDIAKKGLGLTDGQAARIQDFSDKYDVTVNVVGSRASGTAGPLSDFDYVIEGASSGIRRAAERILPRGEAGGALGPYGETGIDVFTGPLIPELPHVTFTPR